MVEVSNGLSSFTLSADPGIGDQIEQSLEEGDEFQAEVHVTVAFGALRGTIVKVEQ
jgi:hypothetical protein